MLFLIFEKWFNDYIVVKPFLPCSFRIAYNYKYTSSLHCYSLYYFTMSSTNDVRVASGESAEAKRERETFKEGAKERELVVLLRQPNNLTGRQLRRRRIRDRAKRAVQSLRGTLTERGQATLDEGPPGCCHAHALNTIKSSGSPHSTSCMTLVIIFNGLLALLWHSANSSIIPISQITTVPWGLGTRLFGDVT